MSLDYLAREIGGSILPIRGLGGISVEPVGFVMMNVKVPCVQGYDEDQIAIAMDDPGMSEWPVILGTPTLPCYGGDQRKRDLQVGCAMGLITSLLADERRTGQAWPGGHE